MGITKNFFTLEQIRRDDLLEKSNGEMALVKVKLIKHSDSGKAILIHAKTVVVGITRWIPKSQILSPNPIALNLAVTEDDLVLFIPRWLAKTNNLTYKDIKKGN